MHEVYILYNRATSVYKQNMCLEPYYKISNNARDKTKHNTCVALTTTTEYCKELYDENKIPSQRLLLYCSVLHLPCKRTQIMPGSEAETLTLGERGSAKNRSGGSPCTTACPHPCGISLPGLWCPLLRRTLPAKAAQKKQGRGRQRYFQEIFLP